MTNEQINTIIAEACGWTEIASDEYFVKSGIPPNLPSKRWPILNYCNDLNAMHEAESVLTDDQYVFFSDFLYDSECKRQKKAKKWRWLSATASQRAEAFLRAIGKWEEVQA